MKRASIIANCHAWPLAQFLSASADSVEARFISLVDIASPNSAGRRSVANLLSEENSNEVIFSFNASERFAPADTLGLRLALGERLVTFTNVRFDGLHPDMTYFGKFGVRRGGFLGEYHSKIILYSYATGRGPVDCLTLFNGEIFQRLGYFQAWEKSAALLLSRDEQCQIKCAAEVLELFQKEPGMFSMNHPTSGVFRIICQAFCKHMDVDFFDIGYNFPNPLFNNFIWPIHDEIAEYHNLPYRTPLRFFLPPKGREDKFFPRTLSLMDVILASYEFFNRHYQIEVFIEAVNELEFTTLFRETIG